MMTQSKCSRERRKVLVAALRSQQLRRVGRDHARREHREILDVRLPDRFARLAVANEQVRQARLLRQLEDLVDARTPHVGIHEKRPLPGLCERDREVAREHALAFARTRTRHHDAADALVCRREEHVRAHGPDRLGKAGGHGATDQHGAGLVDGRNHAEERQVRGARAARAAT